MTAVLHLYLDKLNEFIQKLQVSSFKIWLGTNLNEHVHMIKSYAEILVNNLIVYLSASQKLVSYLIHVLHILIHVRD